MFRQLLAVQWKATRVAVLLATLIGFMIPIASVESISNLTGYAAEAARHRYGGRSYAGIVAKLAGAAVRLRRPGVAAAGGRRTTAGRT